jgi:hypothetical protein
MGMQQIAMKLNIVLASATLILAVLTAILYRSCQVPFGQLDGGRYVYKLVHDDIGVEFLVLDMKNETSVLSVVVDDEYIKMVREHVEYSGDDVVWGRSHTLIGDMDEWRTIVRTQEGDLSTVVFDHSGDGLADQRFITDLSSGNSSLLDLEFMATERPERDQD